MINSVEAVLHGLSARKRVELVHEPVGGVYKYRICIYRCIRAHLQQRRQACLAALQRGGTLYADHTDEGDRELQHLRAGHVAVEADVIGADEDCPSYCCAGCRNATEGCAVPEGLLLQIGTEVFLEELVALVVVPALRRR